MKNVSYFLLVEQACFYGSDSMPIANQLAIDGGLPIRSQPMPPRLALGEAERNMVDEALDHYRTNNTDPGYQGLFESRYCEKFCNMMGGGYADAVATGTAAIYISLAALNLPRGSEVLVSPITDPGTISAIILNGLVPRLLDTTPNSFNVGAAETESRISATTSCALIVHNLGTPADVISIFALAEASNIKLLEDCSQSHGSTINGRCVGTFGHIAAFSTMYRKATITGASGGIVFSRDINTHHQALAHADRGKPRWQDGFDDRNPAQYLFPALNFHTDEISCAIGMASLNRLAETKRRRLAFVKNLSQLICAHSFVCSPYSHTDGDSWFIFPINVNADRIKVSKLQFARAIQAEGIGLNPHYNYLVSDWSWAHKYLSDTFDPSHARQVIDNTFILYLNENYGEREAQDTIEAILKVEKAYKK